MYGGEISNNTFVWEKCYLNRCGFENILKIMRHIMYTCEYFCANVYSLPFISEKKKKIPMWVEDNANLSIT